MRVNLTFQRERRVKRHHVPSCCLLRIPGLVWNTFMELVVLCVCSPDVDGQWEVDVVMSIRPSSSTGVLFALVSNDTVPLSVSVLTREPSDAVRLLRDAAFISQITIPPFPCTHTRSAFAHIVPPAVPAGVLGQHACCEARVVDAVLPRALRSGDACVCS